jgi:hypothetical protein
VTPQVALDNDVILKLARYRLLQELADLLHARGDGGVLGAAPYVVRDRLKKSVPSGEVPAAEEALDAFFASVERLEPSDEEEMFAAELEELAAREFLDLDAGESQLCAIVVSRLFERLLTGDKRAIRALDQLTRGDQRLAHVRGRVACLEQTMVSLAAGTLAAIREAVCSAPDADTSLRICFQCSSADFSEATCGDGLSSYVEDLRASAAETLAPGISAWQSD